MGRLDVISGRNAHALMSSEHTASGYASRSSSRLPKNAGVSASPWAGGIAPRLSNSSTARGL